jgi:hypothetical protein
MELGQFRKLFSVVLTVWVLWHHARYSDGSSDYGIYGFYNERSQCSNFVPAALERFADLLKKFGDKDVRTNQNLRSVVGTSKEGRPSIITVACLPDGIDPRPQYPGDKGLGQDFSIIR